METSASPPSYGVLGQNATLPAPYTPPTPTKEKCLRRGVKGGGEGLS
jgi:hypothetical protein